jgi:hypothetical protein
MTMLTICVQDREGKHLAQVSGEGDVELFYVGYYDKGDMILISTDEGRHLWFQADRALSPAQLYVPSGLVKYRVPTGEARRAHPPQAFSGDRHVITARTATGRETSEYRNVALNPADQNGATAAFPHVSANAETRGESVFEARNVIDGLRLNKSHGDWPYQSWGVDIAEDACVKLEFGRPVRIDKMALTIRADFPHDAYWTEGTVWLSDGGEISFPLIKTAERQWIDFGDHTVDWMKLGSLVKADTPSPFPALTEWEVFGRDA